MSLSRRYLLVSLFTASLITVYYLYYVWSTVGSPSARTPQGRFLGIIGFAAIIGTLFCRTRQRQGTDRREVQDYWHLMLGSVSILLILTHASFRFGNVVATLAFVFLVEVVASGIIVAVIDRKAMRLTSQKGTQEALRSTQLRYNRLRQRWLTLHIALTAGLITFSFIHIISIFYY